MIALSILLSVVPFPRLCEKPIGSFRIEASTKALTAIGLSKPELATVISDELRCATLTDEAVARYTLRIEVRPIVLRGRVANIICPEPVSCSVNPVSMSIIDNTGLTKTVTIDVPAEVQVRNDDVDSLPVTATIAWSDYLRIARQSITEYDHHFIGYREMWRVPVRGRTTRRGKRGTGKVILYPPAPRPPPGGYGKSPSRRSIWILYTKNFWRRETGLSANNSMMILNLLIGMSAQPTGSEQASRTARP